MSCNCDHCGRYIERPNRGHAGYCSPACRRTALAERDAQLAERAAARRERREGEQDKRLLILT